MISILKNIVLPLGVVAVPIIMMYLFFGSVAVSGADGNQAEYCALKQRYILPVSALPEVGTDLNALRELDSHYTETLDGLQNDFGGKIEAGKAKIYYIEPDKYAPVNVTDYSPSAGFLYQNMDNMKINPVYCCNTTLMKDTVREKHSEQKIMSYSEPDLKLHSMGSHEADINDLLMQAFPLPGGQTDFLEYIDFTGEDPNYPDGLYYFYCVDFSGYNVNLYAMYFSFKDDGTFSSIAYDNMILYGNDVAKCYDSGEKDLFATFGTKTDNVNDRLSNPAIFLNTIVYNTHTEKAGTLAISHSNYMADEFSVGMLYSCSLSLT